MAVRRAAAYGIMGTGIVAISFAAIFIRLADAPAPLVAALRMIFAALLLAPVAAPSRRFRAEVRGLSGRDVRLVILAGVLLSLHFLFWIASLGRTDVTSSVVFVTTNPLFVALYSVIVLRERVTRSFWAGLCIALLGGTILGWNDFAVGGGRWQGDLLAVLGSIAIAGYFLVGSRLRRRLSLLAYVFPVYAVSAALLTMVLVASGTRFGGYGWSTYFYSALMALVCQLFGHSVFNWALRHIKATIVTIGVLGEPVGATVLALVVLGEAPAMSEIVGGVCIIGGIFIALFFNPDAARPAI